MQLLNVTSISAAKEKIQQEIDKYFGPEGPAKELTNFEEQAIAIVGTTVYEKLIHSYTEKQWGRDPLTLPAEIIKRLPIRWNCDTTYFNNAKWQGIPVDGYTSIFEKMLSHDNIHIMLGTKWKDVEDNIGHMCNDNCQFVWTGALDELFDYASGHLDYRTLDFEHKEIKDCDNWQGVAVINYCGNDVDFTRITEHKWYNMTPDNEKSDTIITIERSSAHIPGETTPYYPIGDDHNTKLHSKYVQMFTDKFGYRGNLCGRLADYKYYDMDVTIEKALTVADNILSKLQFVDASQQKDFLA
jgi:UDP-galactopyranose mutase